MNALKEWATIVKALEQGDQTIILRKGGIMETASGFKLESKEFLLFPTFEHQEPKHIKPEYNKYLQQVIKQQNDETSDVATQTKYNTITSYAQVLAQADIASQKQISQLSDLHIWSESYIKQRQDWMPQKPIKAVFLKVFKIESPIQIPMKPEYKGCKSWIDTNADTQTSKKQVLSQSSIDSKLDKFKEITTL